MGMANFTLCPAHTGVKLTPRPAGGTFSPCPAARAAASSGPCSGSSTRGEEHAHGPEDAAARAAGHGENVPPAGRGVNLTPVWAGHNVKFAMPIYEYRCTKCRKRFSQQQAIEEHERRRPACPKCKSRAVEQVFSPFFAKTVRKS